MADVRGFGAEHLRVRVVYAHIVSHQGLSIGATHWFGVLHTEHCEAIELLRTLTAEDARTLNKKDKTPGSYRAGRTSNRFLAQQDVRREAIKIYRQSFPLAVLLIEGTITWRDPQHVLIGPPDVKGKLNALHERAQAIGFWDHPEHDVEMQRIADEWDGIVQEIKRS